MRKIEPVYKEVLVQVFDYYKSLSPRNKTLFENRVQKFINQKEFIPEEGLEVVTPEMKALIAASAIQLTFGLPGIYFQTFKYIHVYPDFYFSQGMQQFNFGEVHKNGHIFLSWTHFLEGYTVPDNGRNLGLHEMAHALRLENMILNAEYGYFAWEDIELLNQYTMEESERITLGHPSLLRSYAASHYHEFFAVLVEVFFEQSQQLREYHTGLYEVTVRLLKQDPMNPNLRIR
ncbi:MAG: zinc-dependent peptidase [Marinoscillum sp.]